MKSILIVTEQFSVGGLETHIRGEILHLLQHGFRVHLAVGGQCNSMLLPHNLTSLHSGLDLGPDLSVAQLRGTVARLQALIQQHAVDVVHAHPFSAILPSLVAAQVQRIPALVTLHGPASLGAYGGFLHELLLKQVLLPHASAVIAVSDEVRRLAAPYVSADRLAVLPNGVAFVSAEAPVVEKDPRWCFVGRLDSAKIVGAHDFIMKASAAGLPGVVVVGDGPAREVLQGQLAQAGLEHFVEFAGYQTNAPFVMARFAGVGGMGRVLLEGIAADKPVALVGYDGLKGMVNRALFDSARPANFSGRGLDTISLEQWRAQLNDLALQSDASLYAYAKERLEEAAVWARFRELLTGLKPVEEHIVSAVLNALPEGESVGDEVLLSSESFYGKLEELACSPLFNAPSLQAALELRHRRTQRDAQNTIHSEHKEQVESMQRNIDELNARIAALDLALHQIESQLSDGRLQLEQRDRQLAVLQQSLDARELDWQTSQTMLSERDIALQAALECAEAGEVKLQSVESALLQSLQANANLKQELDARDGELTSLRQTVAHTNEKYAVKQQELQSVIGSNSWRWTQPLRVARWRMSNPRIAAYGVARSLYWALPTGLRQSLNEPRHKFVRMVRGSQPASSVLVQDGDLTWEQFSEQVLSKRDQYKGVFIQELVIDWNVPLYQRPQHMAAALGNQGFLVIYKTDNWAGDDVNGFRLVSPGVWITNRREVDTIDGVVRSIYSTAYANTPEILLENGKRGFLIYEYIDHIDPEISGDDGNIKRLMALKDFAFSGGADLIVASARKLYDEAVASVGAGKVALVQNGVDTKHYRNPQHLKTVTDEKFRAFLARFPLVVGYFGALAPWLWYDTVRELIEQRPDLGFVFIGPDYYGGAAQLPQSDNVLYMGAIDYKILPAYAHAFDVCFIPFKPGEIARTTSPLKLFEYFALEKPVVVTSEMAECVFYPEVFRGDSAAALSVAIDEAIRVKDDPSFKKRLAQLADENDWGCRADAMTAFLREDV